jgi:T-box protein 20
MFPVIKVGFVGCERDAKYCVYIDIVPTDNKRYRYAYHRSAWLVAGKGDPASPNRYSHRARDDRRQPTAYRLYMHPDSPFTGEQLGKQVVSFEKVKVTNNELDKAGHVRVHAHKKG